MFKIDLIVEPNIILVLQEMVLMVTDKLSGSLAIDTQLSDMDPDLQEIWVASLKNSLREDCEFLENCFRTAQRKEGIIHLDEETADAIIRACSAVRLKMREVFLDGVNDHDLEEGMLEGDVLSPEQQRFYYCYVFLAHLQSLIIHEIDPACEEL